MLNKTQSVMGNNNRCKICNGRVSGELEHEDDYICLGHEYVIDGVVESNEPFFNLNDPGENRYTCHVCRRDYNIDLIIPEYLWIKICPKPYDGKGSGGLMCGSCIMEKLEYIIGEADCFYLNSPTKTVDYDSRI